MSTGLSLRQGGLRVVVCALLAALIVTASGCTGHPAAAGTRIEIKLSQKDLSTLVGASREKVNRQLRAWEDGGDRRRG